MPGIMEKARGLLSLRVLVLAAGLFVVLLPIAGIASLRIFENVLHRQTESKLIAEAAYVQAIYLETLHAGAGAPPEALSKPVPPPARGPARDRGTERPFAAGGFRPFSPTIDVSSDPVLPPPSPGAGPRQPAHPAAVQAGGRIQAVLARAQALNLSAVRVLDRDGVVVASTGIELGEDLSGREEVRAALDGRYKSVMRERARLAGPGVLSRLSRYRIFVAQPMIEDGRIYGAVYASRTSLSFFRDLWEGRYTTVLLIVLGGTVLVSVVLSTLITRPLAAMARRAERIAAGVPSGRAGAPPVAPREAAVLDRALTAMVERLEGRVQYVMEFSRAVSHELKTPLTGIRGSVELLRENWREMSDAEKEKFLGIIAADVARMERLVRRLLELARLETTGPIDGSVDLAPIVEDLAGAARSGGRAVSLEVAADATPARIPAEMAETLLSNVIDNAVTHGRGRVTIALSAGPQVTVRDEGPGIPAEHLPRVFDKFFTTARDRGGTGLGLAIVKAIAGTYGVAVSVRSEASGTVVTARFRAAGGTG